MTFWPPKWVRGFPADDFFWPKVVVTPERTDNTLFYSEGWSKGKKKKSNDKLFKIRKMQRQLKIICRDASKYISCSLFHQTSVAIFNLIRCANKLQILFL